MTGAANSLVEAGSRLTHGSAVLGFAEQVGSEGPVAVVGGRTRWTLGGEPEPDVRLVAAPVGVVQYKPDEMIVRVGAGTTTAELNDALAASGQRTALPERGGTVGGAVVVGQNDRDMLGRGAIRTAVLQVTYVSAEGRVVSGGGPTVKNVSGFDMPRLMVGSLGTLGCLAEVILRTNPIPPVSRWFTTTADPFGVYNRLLAPSSVLWDGTTTWVHLEGHGADVESELARLAVAGPAIEVSAGPEWDGDGQHRWSLAPAALRTFAERVDTTFLASIGVGTVLAGMPQPVRPLDPAVTGIHDRMKLLFDPAHRLNPGRHPAHGPGK